MPDGLYDRDALAWADQQAALLRRLAAGERLNEGLDWPNVIEEIQDVGLSELRACESLLTQALAHLLNLAAWPDGQATAHWRGETARFLVAAHRRFSPSMRQRIELADLYRDALYELRSRSDLSGEPRPVSPECSLSLNDLLTRYPEINDLAGKLVATP